MAVSLPPGSSPTDAGVVAVVPAEVPVHPSRMVARVAGILAWLGRKFFQGVRFDEDQVGAVRAAADAGTPVYVMDTHSQLDYLYFNYAFLRFALPLAVFANGINLLLVRPLHLLGYLWKRAFGGLPKPPDEPSMIARALQAGRSCLLFLRRGKSLIQWGAEVRIQYLRQLVELQRGQDRPLVVVPLQILWEIQPESYRRTAFQVLIGDPSAPGRLRKIASFLHNRKRARVQVGRTIDLQVFLRENGDAADDAVLAARLKFLIANEFVVGSKAIRGPVVKPGRQIVEEVMRTPPLLQDVARIAEAENLPIPVAVQRAQQILKKMAADFRFNWLEGFALTLGLLFQRVFTGIAVDTRGMSWIREAAREAPIVLVPAHRSHFDYLMYSFVFYTHGLIAPHITAGENLSFWPMGPIFRHSGAFFIRRSAKGSELYGAVLRHYVRKLLKEGHWMEFYIEGTRSRSGKSLPPKFGILTMIVDAVASGSASNAFLVPASVTYEKVIEEGSYRKEALGKEKQKESMGALARSAKVLGSRYGKVYVEFDRPVNLVQFLRDQGVFVPTPPGREVPRDVIRRLAHVLMHRIDDTVVATPHHLVAFALLTHGKRGMEREALLERVGFLVAYLSGRGARMSDLVTEPLRGYALLPAAPGTEGMVPSGDDEPRTRTEAIGWALQEPVDDVLRIFRKEEWIQVGTFGSDWVITMTEEGRRALDYYKNGLLHWFVPEAMVAHGVLDLAAEGPVELPALSTRVQELSRVFRFEFMYGAEDAYPARFEATVRRFLKERLVVLDEGRLRVPPDAQETLRFFAGMIEPFVEGYRVLARAARDPSFPAAEKDRVKTALREARKLYQLGDVSRPEAVSSVVLGNALAYLAGEVAAGRASDLGAAAEALAAALSGEATSRPTPGTLPQGSGEG